MEAGERHILEVDSVELSFGDRAVLRGACVSLVTGRITALLGRNGEGKSCLMRVICGRLKSDFKSMRIDSRWRARLSSDEVRYLAQGDFIAAAPARGGGLARLRCGRGAFLFRLSFTGWLAGWLGQRVGELSGGARRIVGFYAVVRSASTFVMLDEPFSQVMPVHVDTLKRILREERARKGILLSDHQFRHVADCADRLFLLSGGTVRRIESAGELVARGYLPRSGE